MKSICLALFAAAALSGCYTPPPPVVYHHHYHRTYDTEPGAPIHLENPGSADTFKVEGASQ